MLKELITKYYFESLLFISITVIKTIEDTVVWIVLIILIDSQPVSTRVHVGTSRLSEDYHPVVTFTSLFVELSIIFADITAVWRKYRAGLATCNVTF